MTYLALRYDMRHPDFGASKSALYQAAIEQCEWADKRGFASVMFSEHHGCDDGYLASPIVLASAIAARTQHMRISLQALIVSFHDPLRLAEDLATLDIISNGRLKVTAAGGYVPSEFTMFDQSLADRGNLVEHAVETLRQAWSGEPFEYNGRQVQVRPTPIQNPIPIGLGGASSAAAKRAARIADWFKPAIPGLDQIYEEECYRLGKTPEPQTVHGPIFLHVADNPDEAWEKIAPHALHETNSYGKWMAESMGADAVYQMADDADALRESGAYQVVTPAECIQIARDLGQGGLLVFSPLMGGMPPELGWQSLELVVECVIPELDVEPPKP